jgi:autotransporter-associated beta strand protein
MILRHWPHFMRSYTESFQASRRRNGSRRSAALPRVESLEDRRLLSVNVHLGVAGLNTNDAGGIIEPPDTIAAAGPTAVVELVNSNIAYYRKSDGSQLFSEGLDVFFSPVDPTPFLLSDVSVTYDEQAGRFFVSSMDIDFNNLISYFDFAVSNDSNPLDGFTEMHRIDTTETSPRTGETLFTDFPRLGWNADAYVLSFNMFGFQTQNEYNTQLLTIQKASVLDQNSATLTYYQVDRPLPNSTLVPATMHGSTAGGPMWFVEEKGLEQNGSYVNLRVVKMTNVLSGSPTFTDYYVPVAAYTITPFPGDTLGTVSTALDTRILNLDWRNNQMVAAQNVGVSSDTDVHARWYEISTGGTAPALVQQGTLNPGAGIDTYMPSVALGTDGSIGMTYIESSSSQDMAMYVTGRLASDPTGTMQAGVLAKAGEQYYQGTRVGDFSGITVDPSTGTTYWAANEYAIATTDISLPNWGTWIANFRLGPLPFTWTGGGTNGNWSNPQNWSGGVAPGAGADLIFGPSAARLTNNNDLPAGTAFGSITFSSAGYTITGNNIVLAGGLDASSSTGANSFGLNATVSGAETFLAGNGAADLTVGGTVSESGFALVIGGGNGRIELTNAISGSGGLSIANSGTTTLSGPGNSFSGVTTAQSGTLLLQCSSGNAIPGNLSIAAATVRLNNSNQIVDSATVTLTGSGTLDTNSNSDTIAALSLGSNSITTGSGTLTVTGNVTDGGASTISGHLALGGSSQTFQVNGSATLTISAVISGGGGLNKNGSGTLVLSSSNSYTGGTTLSAGTLTAGNNSALGSGTLTLQVGTLKASSAALSFANPVTLAGNVTLGGSYALTFTGQATLTGNRTLTVSNTGGTTISGAVGESGGSWKLTKTGATSLSLMGSDTYSGGTTLVSGPLALGNNSALGSGALTLQSGTISASGAALSLANSVTLAGNVTFGGSFALTFNGPATLTGNRTLTVSNTARTTFAGVVGQSSSGLGLTKSGAGTLVLSASNTYTGLTTVSGGTLLVNGAITGSATVASGATLGGSGTTGAVTVSSGGFLLPGSSGQPGILSTGAVTMSGGASFTVALNGPTPGAGGYSQLVVSGAVSLNNSNLNVSVGYAAQVGASFTIIKNNGPSAVSGTFNNLPEGARFAVGSMTFQITYRGGTSGKDVVITRVA